MGIAMPGGARRPVVPPSFACPAGDKALTPPWLGQDGSLGVVRSLARGSPGPLRSEPSTRDRGETFRLPERRSGVGRLFGSTAVSPPRAGSGPEGSRAEPLLRGRLLGKGRLLEPKSPSEQNARLRPRFLRAAAPGNSHCAPTECVALDVARSFCGAGVCRPMRLDRTIGHEPEARRAFGEKLLA